MNTLGIDWGEKRWGLAFGDELGVAVPLTPAVDPDPGRRWRLLEETVAQRTVRRLVVGYPLNMDGSAGFKAQEVDAFIAELEKRFGLPVHRVDERLSTHTVESELRATGRRSGRRDRKTGELDSRAAALILQDFLDSGGVSAE